MTSGGTDLTAPGGPFALVDEPVFGEPMQVFADRPRSLRQLLAESGRFGGAEYLVDGSTRLTFAQHLDAVAGLGAALRVDHGVGPGDRVAILAANSTEWILAFWATVSIGAVVASMNAWWAVPEVAHALENAEPTVVIADAERRAILRDVASTVPCLAIETDVAAAIERHRGAPLCDTPIDEDDPAVILYTSGTTGRSKGAVVTHRGLCGTVSLTRYAAASAVGAMVAAGVTPPAGAPPVALVTVPLFHASGIYGFVVGHIANGGRLVVRQGRFDPEDVLRVIEEERVTMWTPLGSMGPRVAAVAASSGRDLSSVRVLGVGGAPVSPAHQALLRTTFPNAAPALSLAYTSSEAVAVITRISGRELVEHPTSAGRVNLTTEVEIRDAGGRPVPDGVDGEIHVRSPYVMRGYWRNDAATAAVLKSGRWLATGDIGCLRDGRLYINARARDMILVNAENVFPTEVEYRLDAHPLVRESAVVGIDDDVTGQAIGAFAVVEPGAVVTADELRAWCRDALAGYKVPTRWCISDEPLPRNPSGKVLKRDLEVAAAAAWSAATAPPLPAAAGAHEETASG